MLTDQFDMSGSGYFTLDMMVDLNLTVHLTKEFTARLGGGDLQRALTGDDGRMTIPFIVSGPFDGPPKFMPNWADILKREAQYRFQKMIQDKLFKKKQEDQPAQAVQGQAGEVAPASEQGQASEKQSTKEMLGNVLMDVLSDSLKKEEKPSGGQ